MIFNNIILGLGAALIGLSIWVWIDYIQIERLENDISSLNKEILFQKQKISIIEFEKQTKCDILIEKEKSYEKIPDSVGKHSIDFP